MKNFALLIFLLIVGQYSFADDFYWGAGIGYLDIDHEDPDLPHFGSQTFNVFTGWDWNQYVSLEVSIDQMNYTSEVDVYDNKSSFEAINISPSVLIRFPKRSDGGFSVFGRFGGSYMDYTLSTANVGGTEDGKIFRPLLGAGIRGKYLFIEYINYDYLEDLHLEQIRIGFKKSF